MKFIDNTIKAKVALDSSTGDFTKGNGWDRPFRDMPVEEIKKSIKRTSDEIENAFLVLEASPRELMELKAELNIR